jgi:metal-responsive CopG/Arc/MetJ family transcriptional regulator
MSGFARFSMTLPAELLPHLDAVAKREHRSRSGQLRHCFVQLYGDGQQVDAGDGDTGTKQGDSSHASDSNNEHAA